MASRTMIVIPCMDTVPARFMTSLLAMRRVGECSFHVSMSSLIYDARNRAALAAIEERADRVLWLDSDMAFRPDLMERLSARIDEGREFVSGLYFARKPPYKPVIYRELAIREREDGKKTAAVKAYEDYPEDGVFEIEASGFGICMTTVRLLRDITERYGLPFTPVPGFGEDLAFCIRAREAGYPLWCDSSIRAGHIGMKVFTEEDWRKSSEIQAVVRCEECKHMSKADEQERWCNGFGWPARLVRPDEFCSRGEREEKTHQKEECNDRQQ